MFLEFFESKGHLAMKSFSLVPHNDNSLLLINSGMAPMKTYFTGQEIPPCRRVCTCQKCIRTGDIENIGKTARHGTFFEMLGNFSFGDYFKTEAIDWCWEFLTDVVGLDPDRLYITIYENDEEAHDIWHDRIGIPEERIFRFGKEDNFWEHGSGPCGPCSEVIYDRGEKYGCGRPECTVGCSCDRFIEVWNNVFSQYDNDGKGHYKELAQKNIDTGMGLERLAVVVQDADSIFTIDTNKALLDRICEIAGVKYQEDEDTDISLRIVADHVKSCTFMISDGIMPSNEGRGYVLRRLLRRAARHGRKLGIEGSFLSGLAGTVIELSKDGYPELEERKEMILKVLTEEEEKFSHTIDQGLNILSEMEEDMSRTGSTTLDGESAFRLYDTYGFPLDLTREIMEEKGLDVDEDGFQVCMSRQKDMARKARRQTNYMGADVTVYQSIDPLLTTEFLGYDTLKAESRIAVLTTEDEIVEALTDGDEGTILTYETPFYGTMGGQVGDTGVIRTADAEFIVEDTVKLQGGKTGHVGRVTRGMFYVGDEVELCVNEQRRALTCRNHSATHLLQKALRTVLGTHVEQAGSYVDSERLRFDFTHFSAMTPDEIRQTEDMVNEQIEAGLPVTTEIMDLEDAKKTGAMALFGEKYGEKVRVVSMGDFSKELCGGTHVSNTAEIKHFKILSESGISAGVRRIEALTDQGVFSYYEGLENELKDAASLLRSDIKQLPGRIESLQEELRSVRAENEKLKARMAKDTAADILSQARDINGVKVLAASVEGMDMNGLRTLGDQLKEKLGDSVVILASDMDGKVNLMATATQGAVGLGAHAGNLIKAVVPCVGGGGGGRPNMAQAGGKDPAGIPAAVEKAYEVCAAQLKP